MERRRIKTITASEAQADIKGLLKSAQKERILVTRGGKPSAVIVGVESYDDEDLRLAANPEFWRMIQERRQGKSIPLAELKARLKSKGRSPTPAKGTNTRRKKGS